MSEAVASPLIPAKAGTHAAEPPAPAPAVKTSVARVSAACYVIHHGWAWAHIFIRDGAAGYNETLRNWVEVSVISDFGEFGFCWSHIGPGHWADFLVSLDFDYAMNKMMGARFRVPLDLAEATAKARADVLDQRRQTALTQSDARLLWDAIDPAAHLDGDARDFLRAWDGFSDGAMYRCEMFDGRWDKPNPQAVGFWAEIWPVFTAAIAPKIPAHG